MALYQQYHRINIYLGEHGINTASDLAGAECFYLQRECEDLQCYAPIGKMGTTVNCKFDQ